MAGERVYVVQRGDCLSSIAEREGFFWKTIWSQNGRLKERRPNPNVLMPGDEVLIPEKRTKEHDAVTEQRHRFLKRGTPAKLRMVLERDDRPIENARYVLTVDGRIYEGTTDDRGFLEVSISPAASRGRIEIEDLVYELEFGGLDPIDEATGIQDRLQNLGFYDGAIDGDIGPRTQEAIACFQSWMGLDATGELDDETRDRLLGRQDQEHEQATQEAAPASDAAAEQGGSEPEGAEEDEDEDEEPEDESALETDDREPEMPDDESDRLRTASAESEWPQSANGARL